MLNDCCFASCAYVNKDEWNTDIWEHKWSLYLHPFDIQRHLKNYTNTLNMDSVIPPFWKNRPPDVLGLSEQ